MADSVPMDFTATHQKHPEHELIIVAKDETEFTDAHHEVWTDE
jgi:hypothetical protein